MNSEDNQTQNHSYNTRSQSKIKTSINDISSNNVDINTNETTKKIAKRTCKVTKIEKERVNNETKIEDNPNESITSVLKSLLNNNNNVINIINIPDLGLNDKMDEDDDDFDDEELEDFEDDYEIEDDTKFDSDIEKEIDELEEKEIYYTDEELNYLKSLPKDKQEEIINLEKSVIQSVKNEIPLRFRILKLNLKDSVKSNILNMIEQSSGESSDNDKYINWVNYITKLPLNIYHENLINKDSSENAIREYLVNARKEMDKSVYGHETAKSQIISILSKEISNPNPIGTVIAIKGPMGNGKTTLIKNGICNALKRPFAFIALGGVKDSSFLTGFEFTYTGSKPGRIVEVLTETKCMNPVIYFDELDKVSSCNYGEEIINTLIHLTDPSQNKEFHDKYFSGIDLDLSRATLIFSYNDENLVNPILLDRMIKIKTDDFTIEDKVRIAKNYLLINVINDYNFNKEDVIISDEVIKKIIINYTNNEKGVRNLRRCLENIISKINVFKYLKNNDDKLVNFNIKNFKLPFTITVENLENFIKDNSNSSDNSWLNMYL
jgi:ATP-dependent Lon protease